MRLLHRSPCAMLKTSINLSIYQDENDSHLRSHRLRASRKTHNVARMPTKRINFTPYRKPKRTSNRTKAQNAERNWIAPRDRRRQSGNRIARLVKRYAAPYGMPAMCELCKVRPAEVLDHCHLRNKFRGWLCLPCNAALGVLGDSVHGINRALSYMLRSYGLPNETPYTKLVD